MASVVLTVQIYILISLYAKILIPEKLDSLLEKTTALSAFSKFMWPPEILMAAKNPTALNGSMCLCVCVRPRAGGVIDNKRAECVSSRQVHKWWPGHHLLPWEGARCSSSFPWRVEPAIEVWMGCHGRLHCTAVPLPWKLSYAPCQQVLCFPLSFSFSVSSRPLPPFPLPSLLIPWIAGASHISTVGRGARR